MNTADQDIEKVIIVGAGLAGVSAAEQLRASGYERDITLVGGEDDPPYDRPPLSKSVMLGEAAIESTALRSQQWYDENGVQLLTGEPVTELDLGARRIRTTERVLGYDRLLLATGSAARRLPSVDESGAPVFYLRTRQDAIALKERLGGRLLIIGGGWIGLEVAAAARAAGGHVVLVETAPLPLARILGDDIAGVFAQLHRSHGVDLRTETTIVSLHAHAAGTTVRLSDGTEPTVDTVVVGIGAVPNTAVAEAAGLTCANGIHVDPRLRTSDPFVFGAGDVASHDHPSLGRIRVEHWDNAIAQGQHAARSLLGDNTPYTAQPYFFSDQYDLGMEYVGHVGAAGYDDVYVYGDLAGRVFTAYWTRADQIVAGMHCGDWEAIDGIRALVGGPVPLATHDKGLLTQRFHWSGALLGSGGRI